MMRRLLLVLSSVALVGAGVTALAGHAALTAAEDLERARAGVAAAQQPGTTTEDAVAALREARRHVDAAEEVLDRWSVDLLSTVPVLGRSWQAERAVARTANSVLAGAEVLADRLPTIRAAAGGVDLSALARVQADLEQPVADSRDALEDLADTRLGLTPPQVSKGVADARAALGPAVESLERTGQGLAVVSGLLGRDRPRSLLVALQNNAELRGAGGYAATFATGRLQRGRLELGPLRDVYQVADPPTAARRVPAPEEFVEDFGPLSGDTTLWRSWNMSPHVPDSALVGARVAGALLPEEPDVVVLLDVPAMGALAGLGGDGITLPDGSTVTADELTDALLVDAYAAAGEDTLSQAERRTELQAAATAAVGRLLAGGVSASEAARTMAELAAQRHLSVWSARPEEQAALVDLGVAGEVEPAAGGDLAHVSVNNVGANKLDYYVDRDLEVAVEVGEDMATVVQRVRFRNEAPAGLVPYVAGYERPGVLVSRVELSLPPTATDVTATVDGRPWRGPLHTGGTRHRLSTRLELDRGASSELEVRYALPVPGDGYRLRLVPQALVKDADLRLTVRAARGRQLGAVTGALAAGGAIDESRPLDRVRDVSVALFQPAPSRWERFMDWWDSPVRIG